MRSRADWKSQAALNNAPAIRVRNTFLEFRDQDYSEDDLIFNSSSPRRIITDSVMVRPSTMDTMPSYCSTSSEHNLLGVPEQWTEQPPLSSISGPAPALSQSAEPRIPFPVFAQAQKEQSALPKGLCVRNTFFELQCEEDPWLVPTVPQRLTTDSFLERSSLKAQLQTRTDNNGVDDGKDPWFIASTALEEARSSTKGPAQEWSPSKTADRRSPSFAGPKPSLTGGQSFPAAAQSALTPQCPKQSHGAQQTEPSYDCRGDSPGGVPSWGCNDAYGQVCDIGSLFSPYDNFHWSASSVMTGSESNWASVSEHKGESDCMQASERTSRSTCTPGNDESDEENPQDASSGTSISPLSAEAERAREVAAAGGGLSGNTTVMIKHIPGRYTQQKLIREINCSGFLGKYDFFYLIMHPHCRGNRGFAFVNFITAEDAEDFYKKFHGQRPRYFKSEKSLALMPADLQGFEKNAQQYASMRTDCSRRPWQSGRALILRQLPSSEGDAESTGGDKNGHDILSLIYQGNADEHSQWVPQPVSVDCAAVPTIPDGNNKMVVQKFCVGCGTRKPAEHRFCSFCGTPAVEL